MKSPRQLTKAEQWIVAYHEAGHAVAALRLKCSLGRMGVSIGRRTDDDARGRCGVDKCGRLGICDAEYEYEFRGRGDFETYAVFWLAGAASQRRFRPRSIRARQVSYDNDLVQQGLQSHTQYGDEEYRAYRKLLEIRAAQLVERCWPQVEAVAAALVERKSLSDDEVHAIVFATERTRWMRSVAWARAALKVQESTRKLRK